MKRWCLLEWIVWDSFEFEKASHISRYSFPNPSEVYARSYYTPFWCDMCNSSYHNITSCPFYTCYALTYSSFSLAQYTRFKVGEPFGFRFAVDDACCEPRDTLMWCII